MTRSKKLPIVVSIIFGLGQTAVAAQTISQQTRGDCSPAVIAQGNVSVNCGISTKVFKRLQREVNEQAKKNLGQEVKLATLIKDFQELKENQSKRDDATAKQAQTRLEDGDFEGAEALFKQSFQQHAQGIEEQQKAQAADAFAIAQIKVLQLNYPEAKTYFQQAVQLAPENAIYLNKLGLHLHTLGEYAKAEPMFLKSLAIREKALGKDHPDVATSLNNLAVLYKIQGNYDQAEPLYLRSLAILEKTLGKDHPDVATPLNNLAVLYDTQGKYEHAEPLLLRSLAIREKALGKDHPDVAQSLNNLANLYLLQGKYKKAEPLYLRSLAITEKVLGKDHPDVATPLNNLALLYATQGNDDQAEPLYLRSLVILEKTLGKNHPTTKTIRDNLQQLQARLNGQVQVRVKAILPDSQAKQLGIQAGDVFTHYNNKPILNTAAFIHGRSLEPATNPAQELKVLRDGKELVFKVKPGKLGAELQEQVLAKRP